MVCIRLVKLILLIKNFVFVMQMLKLNVIKVNVLDARFAIMQVKFDFEFSPRFEPKTFTGITEFRGKITENFP